MGEFKNRKPRTGYTRPSTTMSSDVQRHWVRLAVQDLHPGDIIAGMGVVKTIFKTCSDEYFIEAGEVTEDTFHADKEVFAFVRKVN